MRTNSYCRKLPVRDIDIGKFLPCSFSATPRFITLLILSVATPTLLVFTTSLNWSFTSETQKREKVINKWFIFSKKCVGTFRRLRRLKNYLKEEEEHIVFLTVIVLHIPNGSKTKTKLETNKLVFIKGKQVKMTFEVRITYLPISFRKRGH